MNDFGRLWADTRDPVLEAVRLVGASGWYVLGKQVQAFEIDLARYSQQEHAIGCASGLDAIEIGLRACGLMPGQRVLTTPLSAFATTLAIIRAGGVPVFVDVDASGLIALDQVERCLARDPSIRFCVPVHLYGHALDFETLSAIAARFEVAVIEDCCQAIGAASHGHPVPMVGPIGALSFYPTKNLGALGDGGAVLCKDEGLARTCRALRDYGQTGKYVHDLLGMNSRLDELHAAILLQAFLPRLAAWTARRLEIARRYLDAIENPLVRPLPVPTASASVWHLFPVLVSEADRNAFIDHLRARGIQSAVHYPTSITDQRALHEVQFEIHGELREAARIARGEVSLPIHPYLTDHEVDRVVDAVNAFRGP